MEKYMNGFNLFFKDLIKFLLKLKKVEMRLFLVFVLLFSFYSSGKQRVRSKVSFKKMGRHLDSTSPNYKINLEKSESAVEIVSFCNLGGSKRITNSRLLHQKCLDQSAAITPSVDSAQGISIQLR